MKIIAAPLFLMVLFLAASCSDNEAYQRQVQETIENRIKYLQYNDNSPFNQFDIPFKKPEYFAIDPAYKVNARIERISERAYLTISSSDGSTERYLKYAWLKFSLSGEEQELLVLKPLGFGSSGIFFLAFADGTSGDSTYGGGRYLDVSIGKSDKLVLDFNLAYNPYCAYAPDYSCPFPPAENILSSTIEAGEKDFKK